MRNLGRRIEVDGRQVGRPGGSCDSTRRPDRTDVDELLSVGVRSEVRSKVGPGQTRMGIPDKGRGRRQVLLLPGLSSRASAKLELSWRFLVVLLRVALHAVRRFASTLGGATKEETAG